MIIPDFWDEHKERRKISGRRQATITRFGWSEIVKWMQSVTLNKGSTKLLKNLLTVRKSKDEKNGYRIMAVKAFRSEKK